MPKTTRNNGVKSTALQREQDRVLAAEMALQGKTNAEIAKALEVGRQTADDIVNDVRERWRNLSMEFWHAHVLNELNKLDVIEQEALEAWQQSKRALVAIDQDGNSEVVDVPGDAKYLDVLMRVMENRAKRLRLYDFDPRSKRDSEIAGEAEVILKLEQGSYADTANAIAAAINGEASVSRANSASEQGRTMERGTAANEHPNTALTSLPRALRAI